MLLSLKDIVEEFLIDWERTRAKFFKDLVWLASVYYIQCIFDKLNLLNLSIQGKGGDIFLFNSKINAVKIKLRTWTENVRKRKFSKFTFLENFMKICNREDENPDLDMTLRQIVGDQIELLSHNFDFYFSQSLSDA